MNEALPQPTPAPQEALALVPELPPPTPISGSALPDQSTEGGTIVTSNTKLAATYMTFGYRLRRRDPFYWIDNYQKEDVDKLGLKGAPYKSRCFFNLVPRSAADIQSAKGIGAAFSNDNGQERLLSFVGSLANLTPAEKHQLLYLCSVVIAQGCRETQEKREYLIKQINEMPPVAKWIRVWNGKLSVTFGHNASLETRSQLLAKL
jgi:hypothetical protein